MSFQRVEAVDVVQGSGIVGRRGCGSTTRRQRRPGTSTCRWSRWRCCERRWRSCRPRPIHQRFSASLKPPTPTLCLNTSLSDSPSGRPPSVEDQRVPCSTDLHDDDGRFIDDTQGVEVDVGRGRGGVRAATMRREDEEARFHGNPRFVVDCLERHQLEVSSLSGGFTIGHRSAPFWAWVRWGTLVHTAASGRESLRQLPRGLAAPPRNTMGRAEDSRE